MEITQENIDKIDTFPWYRVNFRPAARTSYCDNTLSRSFTEKEEAIEFAASRKNHFRDVQEILGQTAYTWKYKTIARWGAVKRDGRLTIGRIL